MVLSEIKIYNLQAHNLLPSDYVITRWQNIFPDLFYFIFSLSDFLVDCEIEM